MTDKTQEQETHPTEGTHPLAIVLRAVLAIAILAAGLGLASYLVSSGPDIETTTDTEIQATRVTLTKVNAGDYAVEINVMGTVKPARQTMVRARVSGEIIDVAPTFLPGGIFKKGDNLLTIDPADYELAIETQKAAVQQAKAKLALEQGQQTLARDELKILEQTTGRALDETDLALRKPQLKQAEADLASAQAALARAELDLTRTSLTAPYDALMTERFANLGDIVSSQDMLATLVATNMYWVKVDVPVDELRWLEIPSQVPADDADKGSLAIITMDGGRGQRAGYILKSTGILDSASRLAEVIITVPDPLLQKHTADTPSALSPLVLEDFVNVKIVGKTLQNAVRLPRNLIRDKQTVWLYENDQLVMRPVKIAYADRSYVYVVSGLKQNDMVVTSNIVTPVDGMRLTAEEKTTP